VVTRAESVTPAPAHPHAPRRKATKDAGRIAGLEVLDILDEPTAAALAYSFQPAADGRPVPIDRDETVLVYDLGGGTLDVTLVRLGHNHFQALAIEGDVQLGG